MLHEISLMVHVAAAALWIGGVGFATLVVLPNTMRLQRSTGKRQALMRHATGFRRYALTLFIPAVGITGVLNLYLLGVPAPLSPLGLRVYPMAGIYALLSSMVLVMPRVLDRMRENVSPDALVRRVYRVHWFVLALGIAAILLGVSARTL